VSNYLFWVEYEDGDFSTTVMSEQVEAEKMMKWVQRRELDIVKAFGWTVDDDSLNTKIIKNKAKKAKLKKND
jgi:hypothetical protein